MDNKFTIKSAFAMGEEDETYGRTWWCTVEEMAIPVKFNLMGGGTVQEQDRITYETQEVKKTVGGKKPGSEYRQLKKVKVEEGLARIVTDVSDTPPKTSDLEMRVKALEDKVFGNGTNPIKDTVAEIDDEFDMSTIPF